MDHALTEDSSPIESEILIPLEDVPHWIGVARTVETPKSTIDAKGAPCTITKEIFDRCLTLGRTTVIGSLLEVQGQTVPGNRRNKKHAQELKDEL